MHVAFLVHSRAEDHLGGSELSLLGILDAWRRRDADVRFTLITPSSRSALARAAAERDIPLLPLPYEGWVMPSFPGGVPEERLRSHRDHAATQAIVDALRADPADLVLTNTIVAPWGAFAAAELGIPHAWMVRESIHHAATGVSLLGPERTLAAISELSSLVVVNSETLAAEFADYALPERLAVLYPAVDPETVRRLAQDASLPAGRLERPDIVVVGRVTRPKGQWRVIEALGLLARRGLRPTVQFVGAIVERDADAVLLRRARALGVEDQVEFLGERTNPFPRVVAAPLCVNASDFESFGRTTLEAMILGRTVIASRRGGAAELIRHGESGLLFDPDDIAELAFQIEGALRDEELRATITREALAEADRHAARADIGPLLMRLEAAVAEPPAPRENVWATWLPAPPVLTPEAAARLSARVARRHLARRLAAAAKDSVGAAGRWWRRASSPRR